MNHQGSMDLLRYFEQLTEDERQELNKMMRQKIVDRLSKETPE